MRIENWSSLSCKNIEFSFFKFGIKIQVNKDSRNRTHTCDFEDHCSTTKLYPWIKENYRTLTFYGKI